MWERNVKKEDLDNLWGAYDCLKFLWKSDYAPIYIMDNHLAAAWCWMQECNKDEEYNFMHIDQHSDLGVRGFSKDIASLKANPKISLNDYCERTYSVYNKTYRSFQCDNYITACHFLFPNWFNTNLFYYTKSNIKGSIDGSGYEYISPQNKDKRFLIPDIIQFIEKQDLPTIKPYYNEKYRRKKWIVNFDLDFFWNSNDEKTCDDKFITDIGKTIGDAMKNIQVLTIALSPKWCGGWRKALECSRLFLSCPKLQAFCKSFWEEGEFFNLLE